MSFPKTTNANDWFAFSYRVAECLNAFSHKTGEVNPVLGRLRHYAHSTARGIQCRLEGDIITAQAYERAADFWYQHLPPEVAANCWL
ncbi:MAG: hypothetical protein L0Y56_00655 [Nitrospira sp.]|nr:hypothetical protein [Nitrospira sp.]